MTIVYTGRMNIPNITCLSTDIIGGAVVGANPGMVIFCSDTLAWYIVRSDMQVVQYVLPMEVTLSGDLSIGAVEIKDATTATRATVGANGLAVDAYINRIDQSVAESVTLSPLFGNQDVAVPGTAEPLVASSNKVIMAVIFAKSTNTSPVYVGTAAVDKDSSKQMILQPGATVSIDVPLGFNFNLANFYVDADTADDGVNFVAMK